MTLLEIHLDGVRLGGSARPASGSTDDRDAETPVGDETAVGETRSGSEAETETGSRSRTGGRSAGRRVARLVAGAVVVALIARTVTRRVRGRDEERSSLEDAEFVPVDAEDEAPAVDDR